MTASVHSTDGVAPADRASHWTGVIAQAYFPLRLSFGDAGRFHGRLQMREVGPLSLSRLRTAPLHYEREAHHIAGAAEEQYLITLPRRAPVEFRQLGRAVRCDPGGFILERGDEPYRFSYAAANDLCVVKVARPLLADRLRMPDRYCAQVFDGQNGLGGLFAAMARRVEAMAPPGGAASEVLARTLIDLLALALAGPERAHEGGRQALRAAILERAQGIIRANLQNPDLSPSLVAAACGLSLRSLHAVFAGGSLTVARYIREQRLLAARDRLQMPDPGSMADLAYRFGFSDQAQFSRLFRAMFGMTPTGYRSSLGPPVRPTGPGKPRP